MARMVSHLRTAFGVLVLLIPVGMLLLVWTAPSPFAVWQHHSLDWYITHTPACLANTVCIDVWPDHVEISLRLPLP